MYKKYNRNEDIFKKLDNPNVLYTLGLFAADGHVNKNRFNISLAFDDRDILVKIKALLEYSGNILLIPAKINKRGIISQPMCKLDICSQEMSRDILNMGFSSRKTYEGFNLPIVSDELLWHFVRGYFDGDGSFTYSEKVRNDTGYSNKCYNFNITSKTSKCLNQIKTFFNKFGIKASVNHVKKKDIFYLSVSGKNNIAILYYNLYKDTLMFLSRKKEIFEKSPLIIKHQGVDRYKDRYKASLKYKKKDIFLGIFDSFVEASTYRDKTNYLLYGHIAKLNDETNRKCLTDNEITNMLNHFKKYDIVLENKIYGILQ